MPSRNIVRRDAPESYYHVYARGASKQSIFLDDKDHLFFTSLFERYLSLKDHTSKTGVIYPNFYSKIQLLCYCQMTNHFHLLLFQNEQGSITALMRCIMTSYTRYFNTKYKRSGPLFESRYKASKIDQDSYMDHISRYIHLNPRYWKNYPYSSIKHYAYERNDNNDWLKTSVVLENFKSRSEYIEFLEDYESQKQMFEEIKYDLADQ